MREGKGTVEQADGSGGFKRLLKRRMVRRERRKARRNPEVQPGYRKYWGYQT